MQQPAGTFRRELPPEARRQADRLHEVQSRRLATYVIYPAMLLLGWLIAQNAVSGGLGGWNWAVYTLGVLLSALGINSCFLLIHEATHDVLLRSPFWNRWLAVALGVPGLLSFSSYRVLHLQHHDHLGTEDDPDEYSGYTGSRRMLWWMQYNRLLVGTLLYIVAIPFLSYRRGNPTDRSRIRQEYAIIAFVALAAISWLSLQTILLVWLVPLVLANFMINVRGLSQHGVSIRGHELLASRTIVPHPFVRFLLLNENYHLEHHLYPGVPGYNLHRLHRILDAHIPVRVVNGSYSEFLWAFIRASFRGDESPIGMTEAPRATAPPSGRTES